MKDQLGKANSDLDQTAQALDFGLEQSKMKDQNQQGKAFSQPVLHMLNSDAGELFMQAAAQMNKAAGGQSIQQENEAVAGSAIGQNCWRRKTAAGIRREKLQDILVWLREI